ncbi:MAG TPA: hypothetical protein VK887_11570 [Pseudonocardiaceae bacterium]|nr:hypothetical protein [Pseudonocardiaceae bacterium]
MLPTPPVIRLPPPGGDPSPRPLQRCLQLILAQPRTVLGKAPPAQVNVELILGMPQQLLPDRDRDQHRLWTPMRSEEHRLGVTSVEALGDLA